MDSSIFNPRGAQLSADHVVGQRHKQLFFFLESGFLFLNRRMAELGRSRFLRSEYRRDGKCSASCRASRPDAEASVDRRRRRSTERGGRFPRELRDAAGQRHRSSHRGRQAPNAGTGRKLPETAAREGAVVDRKANLPVRTAGGWCGSGDRDSTNGTLLTP